MSCFFGHSSPISESAMAAEQCKGRHLRILATHPPKAIGSGRIRRPSSGNSCAIGERTVYNVRLWPVPRRRRRAPITSVYCMSKTIFRGERCAEQIPRVEKGCLCVCRSNAGVKDDRGASLSILATGQSAPRSGFRFHQNSRPPGC